MKTALNHQQLIRDLRDLGLTERESKVYLALAQLGSVSVTEILKVAAVPKSKIYEILQRLIDKGFCLENNYGYKKRYQAINPAKALQGLIRSREEELTHLKKKTDQIVENILGFYRDPSRSTPFEFIQIIKNTDRLIDLYLALRRNTCREFLEFNKPPYISPPEVINNEPEEHKILLEKGVRIKIIHELSVLSNPDFREVLRREAALGEESRLVESLPLKMVVIDSLKVLILMMDPVRLQPLPIALVIEHPDLAATLKLTFASIWDRATPFAEYIAE